MKRCFWLAGVLFLAVAGAGCEGNEVADTSPEHADDNTYGDGSVSGESDGIDSSGGQGIQD